MKTAPFEVGGRGFTIEAFGFGGRNGLDPMDAICYMQDWLDEQTATQIGVFHTVLTETGEHRDRYHIAELDEIKSAEFAAMCFANTEADTPPKGAQVILRAC